MTAWLLDQWSDAVRESERRIAHGWYAALCAAVFHAFVGGLVATTDGSWSGRLLYPSGLLTLALAVSRQPDWCAPTRCTGTLGLRLDYGPGPKRFCVSAPGELWILVRKQCLWDLSLSSITA